MAKTQTGFSPDEDKAVMAEKAVANPAFLSEVIGALSGDNRRARQVAADVVHEVATVDAVLLKPYGDELADALHRPESLTRWEILGAFEEMVSLDARLVDKAIPGAEAALHDEESGVVRLAAFRLMAAYGATTSKRSDRVWPFISEAVRCYHGDPEFHSMLSSLYGMVSGSASDEVKQAAADLMRFDADNAKGVLKRRATSIVECAPKQ